MGEGEKVRTPDGEVAIVVDRQPLEDIELGTLSVIDSVTVEYPDGTREAFWHTDLEPVRP